MRTSDQRQLFTEIKAEELANISGGQKFAIAIDKNKMSMALVKINETNASYDRSNNYRYFDRDSYNIHELNHDSLFGGLPIILNNSQ